MSCALTAASTVYLKLHPRLDAAALGPQAAAPPPFGVFFDLRWLLVFASSWPRFAGEAVTFVLARAGIITLFTRLGWPDDVPRPSLLTIYRRAVGFAAMAAAVLVPWASLLFGLAVVSVSWLFFAGLLPALVIGAVIHPAAFTRGWWSTPPSWRSLLWVGAGFGALTAGGAAAVVLPFAWVVPFAIVAGVVNAILWRKIVGSAIHRPASTAMRPIGALAIAATLAILAASITFGVGEGGDGPPPRTGPPYPSGPKPAVLLIGGFGTAWDGVQYDMIDPRLASARFSYRGVSGDGRPLSYRESDTHQGLEVSARKLAQQVDLFHRRTNQPITLVGESEGSLIAQVYLAATKAPPVRTAILLSPLVEPSRVYYPIGGAEGYGVAGASVLRYVVDFLREFSHVDVSVDTPLVRSFVDDAPQIRNLVLCVTDGVERIVIEPLADAVSAGDHPIGELPHGVVWSFHGGLLDSGPIHRAIADVILRHELPGGGPYDVAERAIRTLSSAWQVPRLPFSLVPQWRAREQPSCDEMRTRMRASLSTSATPR